MHATMTSLRNKCLYSGRQRDSCFDTGCDTDTTLRRSCVGQLATAKSSRCMALTNAGDGLDDKLNVETLQRCALATTPAVNPPAPADAPGASWLARPRLSLPT